MIGLWYFWLEYEVAIVCSGNKMHVRVYVVKFTRYCTVPCGIQIRQSQYSTSRAPNAEQVAWHQHTKDYHGGNHVLLPRLLHI